MQAYLNLLHRIIEDGVKDPATRGQTTIQSFGESISVDLKEGLPILTTKRINLQNIIGEMLWFISGKNTINDLKKNNINFWNDWADDEGRVESYGRYWRYMPLSNHQSVNRLHGERLLIDGKPYLHKGSKFVSIDNGTPYFDQLKYVYETLKTNPASRRIKLDQWVPQNAFASNLPPCPCHVMFNTHPDPYGGSKRVLNVEVWQRSADVPIGVPYNLAVYGLFATCMAIKLGFVRGQLKFSFTNAHIYEDQSKQVKKQLSRSPRTRPRLYVMPKKPLLEWDVDDINELTVSGYTPHPSIHYPVQS